MCLIHTDECCDNRNNRDDAEHNSRDGTVLTHASNGEGCGSCFFLGRFFEHEMGEEMEPIIQPINRTTKKDAWTINPTWDAICIRCIGPSPSCRLKGYEDLPGMAIGFCDVD